MRSFETLNGYANPSNVCGYCRFYGACVTEAQVNLHGCRHKFNGKRCNKLITFQWQDTEYGKNEFTGDAYREYLKRKKHR